MWFAMGEASPVEGNGCANPPKNVFSGGHPGTDPRAAQPTAPLAGWEIDARVSRFSFFLLHQDHLPSPHVLRRLLRIAVADARPPRQRKLRRASSSIPEEENR
jgi:hypothetical protein